MLELTTVRPGIIEIDVFHDERAVPGWLYHGMLFVPCIQQDWLVEELMRLRDGYDGFLHFVDLRNPSAPTMEGRKTLTAKRWIQFFLNDTAHARRREPFNNFCFECIGINRDNLNAACFGPNADEQVFIRFFRTALLSGIRWFYPNLKVRVRRVFHGTSESNVKGDSMLRWHPMWRIQRDEADITFRERELRFVSADHRVESRWPRQSQLIQFTDLALGGISQCVDCTSKARGCTEIAEEMISLADRLTKEPNNSKSRYYKKYSASFFPSRKLGLDDLSTVERYRSRFYKHRPLKIRELWQGRLGF